MVSNLNTGFPISESRHRSCLFERIKIVRGYGDDHALTGRFENRSGRNGCGVAGFSKRPVSARPSRFSLAAICLAGFRVPAGKPVSQSALLPSGYRTGNFIEIGDAPFGPIADQ